MSTSNSILSVYRNPILLTTDFISGWQTKIQAEYLPINEIAFDMYLNRNTSLPMKMIKNKATKGTNNQLSKYRFIAITKASNDIINSISCHQVF